MMKRLYIFFLLMGLCAGVQAQKMRDSFAQMPDSLLELLTRNNRLDCIDFIENNMPARVRNAFDNYVELKELTPNYLRMELSSADYLELALLEGSDSVRYICWVRTYKGPSEESKVKMYTSDWKEIRDRKILPTLDCSGFWTKPDTVSAEQFDEFKRWVGLPLIKVSLDASKGTLTYALQVDEMDETDRKKLEPFLRAQVYRWNRTTCGWDLE